MQYPNELDATIKAWETPVLGQTIAHQRAQELAFLLSLRGVGHVSPNPPVGCVILNSERKLVGYGWHDQFGHAHAEVNGIQMAQENGAKLDRCTLYVTLEPCAHQGKTPPCSQLIVKHKIPLVYYGSVDPNPKVNNQGVIQLKESGIQAHIFDCCKDDILWSQRVFRKNLFGSPFVALKAACDENHVMAFSGDQKNWITDSAARTYGRYFRQFYDGICVGVATYLLDEPLLTTRLSIPRVRDPKKIILDPRGRGYLRGAKNSSFDNTIFVVGQNIDLCSENVISCPVVNGVFSIEALIDKLFALGLSSVLIEGGPKTLNQFLKSQCWDVLHLFQKGIALSGQGAKILNLNKDKMILKNQLKIDQTSLMQFVQTRLDKKFLNSLG